MNKNGIIASIDKFGNPALTTIIMPLITVNPYWQLAIISAIGLFGVYLQYNQDKLNEFIKFIQDNPEAFTEEIVQTEAFKDGFLIVFESYIKERNKEKRNYIKNIFLDFTKSTVEEKEKFELERLLDIVNRITLQEIEFIKFLNFTIKPIQESYSKKKAQETYESIKNSGKGNSSDWWYEWNIKNKPLTSHLSDYFYTLHNPNSEIAKKNYGYTGFESDISDKMFENEEIENEKNKDFIAGLNSLGLFKAYLLSTGGGIGSGGTTNSYSYNFSFIGKKFIKYALS